MSAGKTMSVTRRKAEDDGETEKIAVVVLAAGASTRMGTPKQLLSHEGQSLLRRAADVALNSICRPVVVVVGAHAEMLRRELNDLPVQVVENGKWSEGMSSSIRAGVEALEGDDEPAGGPEAVVLMLCDQPFVTSELLNQLVAAYRSGRAPIVASEYGGNCGVPALFSRPMFEELITLGGAEGARHLIARHADEVTAVPFARGTFDIDTPADYARLCAAAEDTG